MTGTIRLRMKVPYESTAPGNRGFFHDIVDSFP